MKDERKICIAFDKPSQAYRCPFCKNEIVIPKTVTDPQMNFYLAESMEPVCHDCALEREPAIYALLALSVVSFRIIAHAHRHFIKIVQEKQGFDRVTTEEILEKIMISPGAYGEIPTKEIISRLVESDAVESLLKHAEDYYQSALEHQGETEIPSLLFDDKRNGLLFTSEERRENLEITAKRKSDNDDDDSGSLN
jgi:hypothetical protein